MAARDAAILAARGPDPELEGLANHAAELLIELMRPVDLARLGKSCPVLVLTRELVRPYLNSVTIVPITTTIRGL